MVTFGIRTAAGLAAVAAGSATSQVQLVTFDGEPSSNFPFVQLNDPVMGGQSRGTWQVNKAGGFGVFDGEVVDVPALHAPGFIKAAADGAFADASAMAGGDLILKLRSSTPDYAGFRIAFASGTIAPSYSCAAGGSLPFSKGCYKAKFAAPKGSAFAEVRVPFSAFSDEWSPATGEQTAACADDARVCPAPDALAKIRRVEIWAEGANGHVHLELKSIVAAASAPTAAATAAFAAAVPTTVAAAVAAAAAAAASTAAAIGLGAAAPAPASSTPHVSARPPSQFDTCSAAVQTKLRFNISSRTTPEVRVPVDANESLASAVCCDARTKLLAEPQFLYAAPDIALFDRLDADRVTTFFDSVCGLPLFRAPLGRSLADFEADTTEHGWPSFRVAEVVRANVRTNRTSGDVRSACGTHLGSFLPDARGDRWCMDLSCIAGNPADGEVHDQQQTDAQSRTHRSWRS